MSRKYEAYETGRNWYGSAQNPGQWIAQTFTPSVSHYCYFAGIWVCTNDAEYGEVDIAIYATSEGLPTGSPLCNQTLPLTDILTYDSFTYLYAYFGTPPLLNASQTYAVVVKLTAGADCLWGIDNSDPEYAGGNACISTNSGVTWAAISPNSDFLFAELGYQLPTVTTQAASSVAQTSCTGNGNITDEGGENCTRRGFCYTVGTSGDPTVADSTVYDNGSFPVGAYTKAITGLSDDTGYRVRAYVINPAGTVYGDTVQITTLSAAPPTTTTQAASSVEYTTCTGNGNITNVGGANCTRRGFCYKVGTSGDPSVSDSVVYDDGTFTAGAYTKSITGLSMGTSYRLCAYSINTYGTSYGATVQVLTKPAAPTSVSATDGTHTDKVTITWTKSTGATQYHVWRDAVDLGAAGDVATFDDTGASAPTITPGTASASNGTIPEHVALSVTGQTANNGATHTYKVVASNATGNSADSTTNTGYRGVGSLTYQWQRSADDADADYSNIVGATTASYNDTGAPSDGTYRYYKVVLNATGASQATSIVARGARYIQRWLQIHDWRTWKGVWDVLGEYIVGDVVIYQDGNYIHAFTSKTSHNTGNLPTDSTYWTRIIQEGWRT